MNYHYSCRARNQPSFVNNGKSCGDNNFCFYLYKLLHRAVWCITINKSVCRSP